MRYRTFGLTDLKASEVGFGVWTLGTGWWGRIEPEDAVNLLHKAYDLGITCYDTADVYGEGAAEEVLAKALGKHRHEITYATKFGYDIYEHPTWQGHQERPQKWEPDFIRFACEQSLRRLRTDYIDLYQLHNPRMPIVEKDEIFEALEGLKKEGKIRYYGVALGPAIGWQEEGEASLKERRVTSVQTVYNLLEQDPGRAFMAIAKEAGAGILVRVPHSSDLLTGRLTPQTVFPAGDHRSFRPKGWLSEGLKKIEKLGFLWQDRNMTLGQAAIKYILADKTVASVLPNITSLQELEEYALASDRPDLTQDDLDRVADLYRNNFYLEPVAAQEKAQ